MHLKRSDWLALPATTRAIMAQDLGLVKTKPVEVESTHTGMRVISDGYTDEEISKITPELLQAYLLCSPELDFDTMWRMAIEKVEMFGDSPTIEIGVTEIPTSTGSRLEPKIEPERLVKLADPATVPAIEPAPAGADGLDIQVKPKKNGKAQ